MPSRMRPLLPLLVALAVVAAAALAGCGGDGDDGAQTTARTAAERASGAAGGGAGTTTAPSDAASSADVTDVRLTQVGSFESPVQVVAAPGDDERLFVVEQGGRVRVVRDGRTLPEPFLDVSGEVLAGGEQGLLSIAFAPDHARSGLMYASYTDREGTTRVVEYRRDADADVVDPATARLVLSQEQPESNHNGGLVLFGPDDLLYVGLGDGGGAFDRHGEIGNGQDLGTWLGKLLRIDPRERAGRPYAVPDDNPFAGRAGARPEIWSWGLRNPWRFSFDRETGDLTIADVGQNEREEVDFAPRADGGGAGANFGWRGWEGTNRADPSLEVSDHVRPVLEYGRDGGCSITGGYVVRDPRLPALGGRYVYADYCAGELLSARLAPGRATERRPLGLQVPSVTSFGEDGAGRVYVVSQDGPVLRLDPR